MSEVHYTELVDQALQLPYEQRFELAERLHETLQPPGEDLTEEQWKSAWLPELRRRLAESDAGEARVPLEEAWERIAGKHA